MLPAWMELAVHALVAVLFVGWCLSRYTVDEDQPVRAASLPMVSNRPWWSKEACATPDSPARRPMITLAPLALVVVLTLALLGFTIYVSFHPASLVQGGKP